MPNTAPPPTASRAERMQLSKRSFAEASQPLKDKIAELGGHVLDEAWLNCTISASIPKSALEQVSQVDVVESIDLPQTVTRE